MDETGTWRLEIVVTEEPRPITRSAWHLFSHGAFRNAFALAFAYCYYHIDATGLYVTLTRPGPFEKGEHRLYW